MQLGLHTSGVFFPQTRMSTVFVRTISAEESSSYKNRHCDLWMWTNYNYLMLYNELNSIYFQYILIILKCQRQISQTGSKWKYTTRKKHEHFNFYLVKRLCSTLNIFTLRVFWTSSFFLFLFSFS